MESNDELKTLILKAVRAIILMSLKIEDFCSDNIWIDKISYGDILIYNISYKILFV